MVRFTRTLQKRVTKTGAHYVLSVPREVAQDLHLDQGGLCSLEVKVTPRGRAEVALNAYQDDPLYIRQFNIEGLDVYDAPLTISCPLEEPITKGPSQAVTRQAFKPFLAASRIAIKVLKIRIDKMMSTPSGRAAMAIALRKRGF
jgi:hypothetical protein